MSNVSLAKSLLPARGEAHEADEALAKLERMSKAKEKRQKWRRVVGIDALTPRKGKKREEENEGELHSG